MSDTSIADFQLRAGTQDQEVFDNVYVKNEYELPDHFEPNSLIIDIGANIGAFAVACLMRGAGTVVCFEPDENNFRQLLYNTKPWADKVAPFQAAVWRSDIHEHLRYIPMGKFTACGGVVTDQEAVERPDVLGKSVPAMGLDDILYHVTDGGKRHVDLLKIDAEGSEYRILFTSRKLFHVDKICGELHMLTAAWEDDVSRMFGFSIKQCSDEGVKNFLLEQGFTNLEFAPTEFANQRNNLFWASRS